MRVLDLLQLFVVPDNRPSADDAGNVVDYVKTYARQEIVGPIEGAGRWIGAGVAGTFLFGIGLVFLVLGTLRLLQTEFPGLFHHKGWSLLTYLIALLLCGVVVLIGVLKIRKPTLEKGSSKR
jgi:hypothetical protein